MFNKQTSRRHKTKQQIITRFSAIHLLHCKTIYSGHNSQIQGDSLARGPKLLSIKNYVNQLTDDELTTGYYQQDGATCHTSNASMREIESFFRDRIISKTLWPPRSPDLTPDDFFLWGLLKGKVYKNTPPHNRHNSKKLYAKRFKPSTSTLWEKYSRIWRNTFKCAWM